ncbi:MAG: alpha/beta fold hydrolase [Aggregatilineales bacterium]
MPFITVNDATFFYEDLGAGVPLVFFHGFMGSGRSDTSAELDWLAARYRVIAPDLRGYSQSYPKPRTYPADFYKRDAADMVALIQALKLDRPHVLGFSDGGEVALVVAERITLRSATAWGAIGFYGPEMTQQIKDHVPPTWITEEMKARQGSYWERMPYDWVDAMLGLIAGGGDISHADAAKIACPLLIMLGTLDRLNPIAVAERLVKRAPNGRLEVFENVGHMIQEQAPERFRQVLGDFLAMADRLAETKNMPGAEAPD